jgi:hypothetical protein
VKAAAFAIAAAAVAAGACGGVQSSYQRTRTMPGELVWRYDNKIQVTADGRVIGEAGDWGTLAPALGCVPEAQRWASSASRRDGRGKVLVWTGVAVMLAAVAGGTYLALEDLDDTEQALTGLGVMGGGLVFGLATVPTGAIMRVRADSQAIDAVNRYNDEVWSGRACVR